MGPPPGRKPPSRCGFDWLVKDRAASAARLIREGFGKCRSEKISCSVERDASVGESAAGDGHPITINGTVYAKGLGTNAVSDVAVYLGGKCSAFTATVGMDDEKGNSGTVTFSVVLDGVTLVTTPVVNGSTAAININVPVANGQVLDLVVGDAGDGNGNDHGDWANPVLTCAG